MTDSEKQTVSLVVGYILKSLLAIIAFFLTLAGKQVVQLLSSIQKDVISLKIELTEIRSSMMTEDRVRELIRLENSKN